MPRILCDLLGGLSKGLLVPTQQLWNVVVTTDSQSRVRMVTAKTRLAVVMETVDAQRPMLFSCLFMKLIKTSA
jgi:hypothetical protein